MRNEKQEITDKVRPTPTLTIEWWRRFGVLCLQLCLFWAATAELSLAQEGHPFTNSVTFTSLASFSGADGSLPASAVVQGTDGNLYGTTSGSFLYRNGGVFRITTNGTLTSLYNFCSQTNCADGTQPFAGLALGADGNFYGTTASGGAYGYGTVFKISSNGALTTLYSFCAQSGCPDGANPGAALVQGTDRNFYGTTGGGGPFGEGTVFKISLSGVLTTLYSFCAQTNCVDGASPNGLTLGSDGNLYGTTAGGGTNNNSQCVLYPNGCGTVFEITPSGALSTLYSFCSQTNCLDGQFPIAAVVQAPGGNFYGTAYYGGSDSDLCPLGPGYCGTVFEITRAGAFTTLYSFCSQTNNCDGGYAPNALIRGTDGKLYATAEGGTFGYGTLFSLTPKGTLTTLHNFDFYDGWSAGGGLFQATNGTFYGTTSFGGTNSACQLGSGCGTVFSLAAGLRPFVETVPTSGTVGEAVTILGNDLTDATHVRFNHTEAAFQIISATEIEATVPAGATTGFVSVNRHGPRLQSNVQFRVP
jgi:uncharacterized repeat protein (TIGR03803 family)